MQETMTQVKIFKEDSPKKLESAINEFLESLRISIEIVDIKFDVVGYSGEIQDTEIFTALVIYKVQFV